MGEGPILRGLTLWRPWPAAIVHGPKRVENRGWAPPKHVVERGLWIAIHAGRRYDRDADAFVFSRMGAFPADCDVEGIVGVARVTRCYDPSVVSPRPADLEWAFGPCCWELDDVHALKDPIPCRGRQGLWHLPVELDVEDHIRIRDLCVLEDGTCVFDLPEVRL